MRSRSPRSASRLRQIRRQVVERPNLVLQPKKSLGQNFLADPNTIRKIVASLDAPVDAAVVEIGPGTGAMTGLLMERHGRFIGIEIDQRAVDHLRETLPNATIIHKDVLDVNWDDLANEFSGRLFLIGNLPYYITSQILFSLIDARSAIAQALLMMQLEVAQRLVAVPRTKAYGILSVVSQLYTRPEMLFRVSPNVFVPRPDVTSAVVRLSFDVDDPHPDLPDAFVRTIVRTAFNQRRKTLRNSLRGLVRQLAVDLPDEWAGKRPEELAPFDFVALARDLHAGSKS